jgi:hypothetical protein
MLSRLLSAIHSVRPHLTLQTSAVVDAIVLSQGPIGTAQAVARELGLPNRFRLARLLETQGLPPLHRLAEWITVLAWVVTAERRRVSLCWLAFRSRRHPSACYRLVKRVTGLRWEEVESRGSAWLMQAFLRYVRAYARQRAQRQSHDKLTPAQQYGFRGSPFPARKSRIRSAFSV